jgi:NADH dehydrogenase
MQFDGVANTIMAAKANGVERLLLMSANGANCPGTRYQETKKRAEDLALASGLDVTIFRPSVIFGDPRGRMEFATQLYRDMVRKPLPAFSFYSGASPTGGAVEMSPIHIQDLARGLVNSLDNMATFGKIFSLGGPDVLSWPEMIRRIASATGREKWLIPTPIVLMKLLATLLDWLPFFPVTRDQLTMLAEGNTAAPDAIKSLTGDPPISFSVSRLQYLRA